MVSQAWSCGTLEEGVRQVMAEAQDAGDAARRALVEEEAALVAEIKARGGVVVHN